MKLLMPALLALAVSACAVGPDYQAPASAPVKLNNLAGGEYDPCRFGVIWWQQFDAPTLTQLVQHSLQENRELRVAFARLRAARAIRDDAANDQLPTVTSRASGEFGKAQQPPTSEQRTHQERYDLGLDMAWELDLFGRIQRQIEASEAAQDVAEAELQQLQVSLIAELVDAYGDMRGAQPRKPFALNTLNTKQESRVLTERLRDTGAGS